MNPNQICLRQCEPNLSLTTASLYWDFMRNKSALFLVNCPFNHNIENTHREKEGEWKTESERWWKMISSPSMKTPFPFSLYSKKRSSNLAQLSTWLRCFTFYGIHSQTAGDGGWRVVKGTGEIRHNKSPLRRVIQHCSSQNQGVVGSSRPTDIILLKAWFESITHLKT